MGFVGGKPRWKTLESPPPEVYIPDKKSRKRQKRTENTRHYDEYIDKQTWTHLTNASRRGLNIESWRNTESEYVEGLYGRNKNLCAQGAFCRGTLGYSREMLPQIKPAIEFLSTLAKFYKINTNIILRPRSVLIPSQGEICKPKVDLKVAAMMHDLAKNPHDGNARRSLAYLEANPFYNDVDPEMLIVSSDGPEVGLHYIVDGHHKWAATKIVDSLNGTDTELAVAVIQAPFEVIIDIAKTMKYPSVGMNHINPYQGCYTDEEMAQRNSVWIEETFGENAAGEANEKEQKNLQKNMVKKWAKRAKTRKSKFRGVSEPNSAAAHALEQTRKQRRFGRL